MPSARQPADAHVLAAPRGHCREIRRLHRMRLLLTAVTVAAVGSVVARLLLVGEPALGL